jgi:hypothetical protein
MSQVASLTGKAKVIFSLVSSPFDHRRIIHLLIQTQQPSQSFFCRNLFSPNISLVSYTLLSCLQTVLGPDSRHRQRADGFPVAL